MKDLLDMINSAEDELRIARAYGGTSVLIALISLGSALSYLREARRQVRILERRHTFPRATR